jgi:SP family arabinose:H+ symporter-like MFS transporter
MLALAILVTMIGGFLFGYDTAVISGAVGFIRDHFHLDPVHEGWAGASAVLGCIPGTMCAGFLSDKFGRKPILILCAILFAGSGIASALPRHFSEFIAARFVGGLGIGAASMICPLYIAEISPRKWRGRMGSMFQLGIVTGIFLVFFANLLIQRHGDLTWNQNQGWRWMLGSETLPAILFLILLFLVPESPRWLAMNGQRDRALEVFRHFVSGTEAETQMSELANIAGEKEGRFSELFKSQFRMPLLIAIFLAILSQFSGINAIMYYAPEVFRATGGSNDRAFASAVWVGAINFVFTFVAIGLVDKAGRKPLLVVGATVQTVSLLAVAWLFHQHATGPAVLTCVLIFVAAFAMAMGPIPWILITEIFPARIRGRASSVGVFMIWVACFVVAQTFPVLKNKWGPASTFAIYAICSLLSVFFVLAMVPETKGRSLEEIEASWRKAGAET